MPVLGSQNDRVSTAGDTMTGPLVLPGNAVSALQAVPKQQLDALSGTYVPIAKRPINIVDAPYNADPLGVGDATAAINSALATGKAVHGQGIFKVSDTLLINEKYGCVLSGPGGVNGLILQATAGLAGKPMLMVRNSSLSGVRSLSMRGVNFTHVACAIESREDNGNNPTGYNPTGLIVEDCKLGDSSVGFVDGIKWTTAGLDQNNDFACIRNVEIHNLSGAAYNITHSNSLLHRIEGGRVINVQNIVKLAGGSFSMVQCTADGTCSSFEFDFLAGTYYHPSYIESFMMEGHPLFVRSNAAALGLSLFLDHFDDKGSAANTTPIEWNALGGRLHMTASKVANGQSGIKLSATSPSSVVTIIGGELGFNDYRYAGKLIMVGVTHTIGSGVTFTSLDPGSVRFVSDNFGGGVVNDVGAKVTPYVFPSPLTHGQDAGVGAVGGGAEFIAFTVTERRPMNRILIFVGASSGNIDVAVYGTDTAKLAGSGSIACPAVGAASITIPEVMLSPGRYYVGIAADNGVATFRYRSGLGPLRALSPIRYVGGGFPLPATMAAGPDTSENAYLVMAGYV